MENTSQRALALEFLKRYVIGKCIVAAPITSNSDNDLIITYEEDAVFSNLTETLQGFSFDMITLARGTRYLKGDKILAEGSMNAVRVIRYEITERLSTGNLVGYSKFVSTTNTHPDPYAGTIFLVRMWVNNRTLKVRERHVGYGDVISAHGNYIPMATEGKYIYGIKKGRLVVKYQQATFDVDPQSLKRTPTNESFPIQISREIAFPTQLEPQ